MLTSEYQPANPLLTAQADRKSRRHRRGISSKWQFLPFIERDLHQFNRIDVCNVGGLTESMKVAGWSEAHYVDMMPHNPLGPICTAATIHFAAAVANFSWLETRASPAEAGVHRFDDDEFFPVKPRLDG